VERRRGGLFRLLWNGETVNLAGDLLGNVLVPLP
jgi:hypothetical protein